ncbi:hypothetical protein J3A83DRAFT_4371530 [Scleroderma citrinum]
MTSTPGDTATFEAAIISACAEHERAHRRNLCTETQKYVFQCAKGDMSAPRIPEVLYFFHRNYQMAYMVMEIIKFIPLPVPDLPERVALALQWLRDLPAPPDRVWIGPLGGGRARHTLFKNYKAPLSFLSIQAIERYLNTAITRVPPRSRPVAPISLRHERLVFTQSDMDKSNFGIDDEGRTCLLDFGEVGLLPESFARYTMSSTAPFTAAVAQHLSWPSCSNLDTMSKISGFLWIYSDPTLGLDDDGNPKIAS